MADQAVVSEFNRTPVVQIVTWFCLVVSTLAFFSHFGLTIYISRSFTVETGFVFLALLFASAQSITISIQTSNGFGKPSSSLGDQQLQKILESEYAATILLFFSIAFSKLAIVAFIHGLTPKTLDRRLNYTFGAFSVAWLVMAVFVTAFQCPTPRPWDRVSGGCIDAFDQWMTVTIVNIVSEVALVGLEMSLVVPLQMPRKRKLFLISLFTCRLLVSLAAAVQLHLFQKDLSGPLKNDVSLGRWRSTICNQVVQCVAIVTTSLPYTKIFMASFESGLMRAPGRKKEQSADGSGLNGRAYELLEHSHTSASRKSEGISKTQTFTVESTKSG